MEWGRLVAGMRDEEGVGTINLHESKVLSLNEVSNTDNVRILSFNARSINNKFSKIRDIVNHVFPEVVCVQETWGKNATTDYSIKGYHKPEFRTREGIGMNLGGGVAAWIRADTDYEVIKSPFISKEIETLTIFLPDLELIIINVYRPFGDKDTFIDKIMSHVDNTLTSHKAVNIMMLGDFNLDLTNRSEQTEHFMDETINRGFLQQVTEPTRKTDDSSTLIDHVYSRSKLSSRSDVIVEDLSDHNLILTTFITWQNKAKKIKITKRWLDDSGYKNLKILLGAEDWSDIKHMTLEQSTDHLIDRITEALDIVAPIETKEVGLRKLNPWLTQGLKISLKNGQKLYRKMKKSLTGKQEYKKYKKTLDMVIKQAKNGYYNTLIREAGADTRKLWSILNEIIDRKQCRHKMPNRFWIDGKSIRNKKNIANAFNAYFASIGKEMADQLPNEHGFEDYIPRSLFYDLDPMKFIPDDEEEISSLMKRQQPKLSCGIDTINNKIVKICHKELALPMTHIINKSMEEGKVPSHFKKALIKPLYKKGAANQCGNYRPVSLLPSLSKILEKAICRKLMSYLERNQTLCDSQYGFRPKNQTTHVVHNMMNFISEKGIDNEVCLATYIDLSKAFDCLQYDKLFLKLDRLGVQEKPLEWFKDYLSSRKQQVDIDGEKSDWLDVKLGVPQGSILGPILFLIYMNDINKCDQTVQFTKFADDTTILCSGKSLDIAVEIMTNALQPKLRDV